MLQEKAFLKSMVFIFEAMQFLPQPSLLNRKARDLPGKLGPST